MRAIRWASLGWACLGVTLVALGCGEADRPPPFGPPAGAAGGSGGSGGTTLPMDSCQRPPDPAEDDRSCGNEIVPVLLKKPNLYFVLDVSASMSIPMDGGATTRMQVAKSALSNLLYDIGHRINYGMAVFPAGGPDPAGDGACAAGEEVFVTQEGDPIQCLNLRRAGPVLASFLRTLNPIAPVGGTPLGASLSNIAPVVTALDGTTAIVLITDGAPNCALEPCEADLCGLNVEGFHHAGQACNDELNCCDPEQVDWPLAPLNCVDRPGSTAAVAALAAQGVKTYVVGIPGTEYYADLLDGLAEAGGTAREGARKYYAISDSSALQAALREIGNEVAITCDITLQSGSYQPNLTNVYFDATVVPASETDGWIYADQTIHVLGSYCDDLLAGNVARVQVVSGCPTIVR